MQQLAQIWLVLEISQSPFKVGLDAFLGQIPIFLFSLVGGVVADRTERRTLLLMSQVVQMICAFTLAALVFFNLLHHDVWPILALSFVVGTAQAFGGPAYSALVPTLVKSEDLPNAIAMNSIQFNLARSIGPMLGGLALIKWGAVWCFGLNGVSFIAVIISLFLLNTRYIPARTGESMLTSMKEGIAFVRKQEAMVALIVLAFCMTMLAIPLVVFLSVFAKDVFHKGPEAFTMLLSFSGAGSVAGALIVAGMGRVRRLGRAALIMLIVLAVLIVGFSLSKSLPLSCALVFLSGAALMSVFTSITSLVQLITTDGMRGRVMSDYNVAFRGGMPIGSLVVGALIPRFTAPVMLACSGVLLACLGLYFLFIHRRVAAI